MPDGRRGTSPADRRRGDGEDPVPPHLRKVVDRAVRRLEVFEWIILFGAAVFSVAGGALVAFIAEHLAGAPFRVVWVVASVSLFGIPGWAFLWRNRD